MLYPHGVISDEGLRFWQNKLREEMSPRSDKNQKDDLYTVLKATFRSSGIMKAGTVKSELLTQSANHLSDFCLQLIFDPAPVTVFGCRYSTQYYQDQTNQNFILPETN